MARHGENIRKRKDGRWEGRYLIYNTEKGMQKYQSVYGKSYAEVKQKLIDRKVCLREISDNAENNKESRTEKIMFSEVAEQWLLEVKDIKKLSTFVKYSLIYRQYLKTIFHNIELSQITNTLVQKKISDNLSESIKKSIYCVLNQILKFASRNYGINPVAIKMSITYTRKKPVCVLSKKEQAKLLHVLCHKHTIFKVAILLCLYTGMRLGEVCALKWEDIDFENNLIIVNRTVQRLYVKEGKTALVESTPKSEHSRREIPLSREISEILLKIHHKQEYIFGKNNPLDPRRLQYHFKKILNEANLANKNFHSLRHTFSTNCIEKGADIKSLSEILGHSDVQITLNRYVHPSMETKRRYLIMLSEFYGQICGQTG